VGFEQSNTQKNEFGAEIWRKLSSSRLLANGKRNLKIINFIWCKSLQSELLSLCILKHIKYYFGGSFVE